MNGGRVQQSTIEVDSLTVVPGQVTGSVRAPASKSETHRVLLLAAGGDRPARIEGPLVADDTQRTLHSLTQLGAAFEPQWHEGRVAAWRCIPSPFRPPAAALECGNSGTTLRLLAATAARLAVPVLLTGDDSLRRRPNQPLLAALAGLGVATESNQGCAPLRIKGPLRPGLATLPSGASSQFASALLLSLPFLAGDSILRLQQPIASAPYLDVTEHLARQAGLHWQVEENESASGSSKTYHIPGAQTPTATHYAVGGDWSNAAFWMVAAAITSGDLTVTGLNTQSAQGDRAIVAFLESFGAKVRCDEWCVHVAAGELTSPGCVDVSACPDLFAPLAILAACSRGTTLFVGGSQLRGKESDRIAAMADGLRGMGIQVNEGPESLQVTGGALQGAAIKCQGDHRIHMAFAVAALAASGPSRLDSAGSVRVSYPAFHDELARLTGAA